MNEPSLISSDTPPIATLAAQASVMPTGEDIAHCEPFNQECE